jgi:hypothetical protein
MKHTAGRMERHNMRNFKQLMQRTHEKVMKLEVLYSGQVALSVQ